MEIKDYVKQFLETYGTSGKAERVTCRRVTRKLGWQTSAVEEAVAKATAALKADYEERLKAMAAEYEAKIAEIQNQKEGKEMWQAYECNMGALPAKTQEDAC